MYFKRFVWCVSLFALLMSNDERLRCVCVCKSLMALSLSRFGECKLFLNIAFMLRDCCEQNGKRSGENTRLCVLSTVLKWI